MTCCAASTCAWTSWVLPTWGWSWASARRCWWRPSLKQLVRERRAEAEHPNAQVAHSQTAAASSGLINGEGSQPPAACHHLPSALSFPGRQLDKVKAEAQEKGDLGLVAESSRSNQRMMFQPASLTAGGVFRKLKEIASMSGNSVSQTITFSLGEKRPNIFCYIYSVSSVRSRRRRHAGFFFC